MIWKNLVLIFVLMVAASGSSVFATSRLSSTTQKGSLLIFPRIEALAATNGATGFTDTLINITNDSSRAVNLQCYWGTTELHANGLPVRPGGNTAVNKTAKLARAAIRKSHYMAFSFTLTKTQPANFWAGELSANANSTMLDANGLTRLLTSKSTPQFNHFQDGTHANVGELRCWTINNTGEKEIHHNHLTGKATIYTFEANSKTTTPPIAAGQAHEYNAWAFQAYYQGSNNNIHTGEALPTPGQLNLDGKEYDLCPSVLVGHFIPSGHPFITGTHKARTQISIANCQADLRQGGSPHITHLTYSVYNANQVKFSGASECMGAWTESDVGKSFSNFSYKTLKTDTAYFVARPTANKLCNKRWQTSVKDKDITTSGVVGIQVNDLGGKYQSSSNLVGLGDGSNTVKPIASTIFWEPSVDEVGKR